MQISENVCEILVKWDPPANSVDIINYMVYVSALDMKVTTYTDSFVSSLLLRDCPESFGIIVTAINRFGCIGINSSEINIALQMQPASELSSESGKYNMYMHEIKIVTYWYMHVFTVTVVSRTSICSSFQGTNVAASMQMYGSYRYPE